MISGVTVQVGEASETFRLSTRAMRAVEDTLGAGIVDVMGGLETGFKIGTLACLLAECANDGKGRDIGWADDAIDQMGVGRAGEVIGEIAEAAFPEAAKTGKNPKRAARSK